MKITAGRFGCFDTNGFCQGVDFRSGALVGPQINWRKNKKNIQKHG